MLGLPQTSDVVRDAMFLGKNSSGKIDLIKAQTYFTFEVNVAS